MYICMTILQVVRLRDVFPHGPGFVLVFDYMLSDLAEVVRNSEQPLTEVSPLSQLRNIFTTKILILGSNQKLHDPITKGRNLST